MEYAFQCVLENSSENSAKHPLRSTASITEDNTAFARMAGLLVEKSAAFARLAWSPVKDSITLSRLAWFLVKDDGAFARLTRSLGKMMVFRETLGITRGGYRCFRETAGISRGWWWPLHEIFRISREELRWFHDTRYSFHGTFTIAHKGLRFFHENLWRSVLFSFFRGNLVVFWKFCCELSFILVDLTPFSVDLFTCFLGDRVLASKGFVKSLACSQDLSRYPGTLPGIGRLLLQLFPSFDKNCDFPVFEGFLSDFTL